MVDTKLTDLTAITGANTATGDLFETVDVSDTTMAASGTNKKITRANLAAALLAEMPELNAVEGLTSAADKGIQFTGSGTAATFDLLGTQAAWSTWTPTLSSGWALGNSTHVSGYARVGRMIHFYTVITLGTTATKGTTLVMALPVTAAEEAGVVADVRAVFHDVGTNAFLGMGSFTNSSPATATTVTLNAVLASGTNASPNNITSTAPFTWVTGDRIAVAGTYEASS